MPATRHTIAALAMIATLGIVGAAEPTPDAAAVTHPAAVQATRAAHDPQAGRHPKVVHHTKAAHHTKNVVCGNDRVGGLFTRVPKSWVRTAHSLTFCRWTSPDRLADVALRLSAPSLARMRANTERVDPTYVEYAWERVHQWGGHAKLWNYATDRGSRRERDMSVQEYGFRLSFHVAAGHYEDFRPTLLAIRSHSGAAG